MYFDGKFWVDLWRKLFIDPVTFIHLKNSHLITCWNAILIHSKFLYGLVTCKTGIRIAASLYNSESKVLIHAQPTQQLSDHFEMILERLSFQQNYNQYFVNAFIINLNKYFHFRCERGPITTLLMFISTSKMLNHNAHPFFRISIESERNFEVDQSDLVSSIWINMDCRGPCLLFMLLPSLFFPRVYYFIYLYFEFH